MLSGIISLGCNCGICPFPLPFQVSEHGDLYEDVTAVDDDQYVIKPVGTVKIVP